LLRPGLLEGASLLVVGSVAHGEPPLQSLGQAVCEICQRLGARVRAYSPNPHAHDPASGEAELDAAVASAISDLDGIGMLVVDGLAMFASGGLRGCLDGAWDATRAVVNLAFLPAEPTPSTRRIVYLAPSGLASGGENLSGEQRDAARAGLENLARTLSVEWARHGIAVVTIAIGDTTTTADEVAALCAYLASPAGAYFSGCLLDLRGP
jgi:hypothetical protein